LCRPLLEEAEVVAIVMDEGLAGVNAVAVSRASFKVENSLPWAVSFVMHTRHFKVLHVTGASIITHEEDVFVSNVVVKLVTFLVSTLITHRAVRGRGHSLLPTIIQVTFSFAFWTIFTTSDVKSFANWVVFAGFQAFVASFGGGRRQSAHSPSTRTASISDESVHVRILGSWLTSPTSGWPTLFPHNIINHQHLMRGFCGILETSSLVFVACRICIVNQNV
jgi:hypothetical protein